MTMVAHRHPVGVFSRELEADLQGLEAQHLRIVQSRDGQRVVHGRAGQAVALLELFAEEVEKLRDRARGTRAEGADALPALGSGGNLTGDVEPHHLDGNGAPEHDVGRIRVRQDVELGRRVGDTPKTTS